MINVQMQFGLVVVVAAAWTVYKMLTRRPAVTKYELPVIKPLRDFDWTTTAPKSLRPFRPIYHITMALQADTPSDLITIDRDYLDRVTHRRDLIEHNAQTVHGCTPQGIDSVQDLYTYLMAEYLPTRYPTIFQKTTQGKKLYNVATGRSFDTRPPQDPELALRVLGETVEEDLFLLKQMDDGHQSVAFMCCFPSGFDPSTKLGKLLKQIHEGVPSYEKIGASMEKFFSKLEVGKSVKRINWSFQTHDELFNCKGNHGAEGDDEIDMDKTFARMELQTLTRLPKTRSILFSFKTYLYPVKDLKNEGIGSEVADAIEGLGRGNAPGMWEYKGSVRWGKQVCKFLRE